MESTKSLVRIGSPFDNGITGYETLRKLKKFLEVANIVGLPNGLTAVPSGDNKSAKIAEKTFKISANSAFFAVQNSLAHSVIHS
jgi:hypothetical protein